MRPKLSWGNGRGGQTGGAVVCKDWFLYGNKNRSLFIAAKTSFHDILKKKFFIFVQTGLRQNLNLVQLDINIPVKI